MYSLLTRSFALFLTAGIVFAGAIFPIGSAVTPAFAASTASVTPRNVVSASTNNADINLDYQNRNATSSGVIYIWGGSGITYKDQQGSISTQIIMQANTWVYCPGTNVGFMSDVAFTGRCAVGLNSGKDIYFMDVPSSLKRLQVKILTSAMTFTNGSPWTLSIDDTANDYFNQSFTLVASTSTEPMVQPALSITSLSGTVGSPLTLTYSGGAGTGQVTFYTAPYKSPTATGCSVSGSSLTATSVGTCTVYVVKQGDTSYDAAVSPYTTVTFAAARIAQSTLTVSDQTGTYGSPLTLSTTGGSGTGALSYTVVAGGTATGCSVAAGVLTSTSAGTCVVTATKADDGTYSAITSASKTITFAKASRTLAFTSTASTIAYGGSGTVAATPSAGAGDGAVTYSAGSSTACSVISATGVVSVTNASGTCEITASIAEGTNYLAASTTVSAVVTAAQKVLTLKASGATVNYGTIYTTNLLTSGLVSPNAISSASYTYEGTGSTSYASSATMPTNAGTYSVTPSAAVFSNGDAANYSISYVSGYITISKAARSLALGAVPATLKYGDTFTVTAAASVGDGTIAYSVGSSTACSVNATSGLVSVTSASGSCEITATIAEGTNHLTASTTVSVSVNTLRESLTVTAGSSVIDFGSAYPTTPLSSGLVGSDAVGGATYTYVGTGSTSYASSTTMPTNAGTYSVTPSAAVFSSGIAANYSIAYVAGTLVINKVARTVTFGAHSASLAYGNTMTLTATASTGDGTITYSAGSSTACSVDSVTGVVTATRSSGTCSISATITEGTNHLAAANSVSINIAKKVLTLTASNETANYGTTYQFSATVTGLVGSDSMGNTSYTYLGTGSTSYGPSTVKPTVAGTYSVTPSAEVISPDAANYAISTVAGTLVINKVARTLSFGANPTKVAYGDTVIVIAIPSVGDGAITYSAGLSNGCSVDSSSGAVTALKSSGTCLISATIGDGTNHLSAQTSSDLTLILIKRSITIKVSDLTLAKGAQVSPLFTFSVGSLASGDAVASMTFTYEGTGSTAYTASAVAPIAGGTYTMTPSLAVFSIGLLDDYDITYVAATLKITEPASISAPAQTMPLSKPTSTVSSVSITAKKSGQSAWVRVQLSQRPASVEQVIVVIKLLSLAGFVYNEMKISAAGEASIVEVPIERPLGHFNVIALTTNAAGSTEEVKSMSLTLKQPTYSSLNSKAKPSLIGTSISKAVAFVRGSTALSDLAKKQLLEVAKRANSNNGHIFLTGFSGSSPKGAAFEKTISERRALTVGNYLRKLGVETWISYSGLSSVQGKPISGVSDRVEIRSLN